VSRRWLIAVGVALAAIGLVGFVQTIIWNGWREYTATIITRNTSDVRSCGIITWHERYVAEVSDDTWWASDPRREKTEIAGPRDVKFGSRAGGRGTFFGLWEFLNTTGWKSPHPCETRVDFVPKHESLAKTVKEMVDGGASLHAIATALGERATTPCGTP
jgi:hypothetical protein